MSPTRPANPCFGPIFGLHLRKARQQNLRGNHHRLAIGRVVTQGWNSSKANSARSKCASQQFIPIWPQTGPQSNHPSKVPLLSTWTSRWVIWFLTFWVMYITHEFTLLHRFFTDAQAWTDHEKGVLGGLTALVLAVLVLLGLLLRLVGCPKIKARRLVPPWEESPTSQFTMIMKMTSSLPLIRPNVYFSFYYKYRQNDVISPPTVFPMYNSHSKTNVLYECMYYWVFANRNSWATGG